MLWINEGFVLDDAGNMLTTSYIDLRGSEERTVIRSLVKGCKREHALEDGKTLLISKPERFREYGVGLIRDDQEGFAREERARLEGETPEEAAKLRATADLNDALQLVGSTMQSVHRVEYNRRKIQRESFSYGKDWWIFCASIAPDDTDRDAWMATLDEEYDHVSRIGQPAKFAEALARMVTEQIGPLGKDAWLIGTSHGEAGARTKHKSQWVIHGPVVYTDQLYEMIAGEEDEVRRMAACLFAKPMTHAAQREYRFVVLNGGATEEAVLLNISGMMRDALAPAERGLIRPSPALADTVTEDGTLLPRPVKSSTTQNSRRATVTERKEEREESRVETRTADGNVLSSQVYRREQVEERIATKDLETGEGIGDLRRSGEPEYPPWDAALPRNAVQRRPMPALPYQEVADCIGQVKASRRASASSKLALEFLVLTAARSAEARKATWDEIDVEGATWTVPAERMKASREHRVPLSGRALEVLAEAAEARAGTAVTFRD